MPKELDRIVLTADIENTGLKAGDVGTIVFVHRKGEAFEVEFLTLIPLWLRPSWLRRLAP